ncbi:hypothetical protein D3C87_1822700 [compost metagenome]
MVQREKLDFFLRHQAHGFFEIKVFKQLGLRVRSRNALNFLKGCVVGYTWNDHTVFHLVKADLVRIVRLGRGIFAGRSKTRR